MDGAALTLLFAAVGFGWQPMPDGSERYEYIVQVDSELAATLADGQSIPIVSDVPEEIRPIGRVRVVIGEGDLPRERLVTRLKPATEEHTIIRGQNAGGQYAYNPPGNFAQPPAAQPLASAPTTWNSGEASPASAPAPSGQALFDSAAQAWNESVAAPATTAVNNAVNNAGQNFSAAVAAPVQAGVDNAANQLQQAYGDATQQAQAAAAQLGSQLGDRTKGLLDEVTRPLSQQPALTARDLRNQQQQQVPQPQLQQPIYPAATPGTVAGATSQPVQSWNQDSPPTTDPLRPGVTAGQPTGVQDWNNPNAGYAAATPPQQPPLQQQPLQQQPTQQQPVMGQAQPAGQAPLVQQPPVQGESAWNTVQAPPQQQQQNAPGSNAPADDPWKYAADPRTGLPAGSAAADATAGAGSTAPFRGAGATWPPVVGDPTAAPVSTTGVGATTPDDGRPKIDYGSLAQAPDRPLDGATLGASLPATNVSSGTAPFPSIAKADIFPGGFPSSQNPKTASPNLAGIGQQPAGTPPTQTPATSAAGRDNGVIALVAWVMLFGSAFGNLYLFWSYLDVRQKYRSLVRKTARAVGSRFSAA